LYRFVDDLSRKKFDY